MIFHFSQWFAQTSRSNVNTLYKKCKLLQFSDFSAKTDLLDRKIINKKKLFPIKRTNSLKVNRFRRREGIFWTLFDELVILHFLSTITNYEKCLNWLSSLFSIYFRIIDPEFDRFLDQNSKEFDSLMMLGFDPKFVIFTHWSKDEKWAQESLYKNSSSKKFS